MSGLLGGLFYGRIFVRDRRGGTRNTGESASVQLLRNGIHYIFLVLQSQFAAYGGKRRKDTLPERIGGLPRCLRFSTYVLAQLVGEGLYLVLHSGR